MSYPHFGPKKNTCSNSFLFLIISNSLCLFYNFYCATNAHFTVIISNLHTSKAIQSFFLHYKSSKRVSRTIACFPTFYSNFCIKSYKRVFWSFPMKEPILVPTICPWVFSICLHESLIKFCTKIILVLHLSQSESVWVVLVPRGILVFSHQINFGQRCILKYLIFGSLFILVRFASFNCFTLRCFQIYIFYQFYFYFFASKSKFHF